jgi:hypothetical protein
MGKLARSNPERERTQPAMGAGVAIAANDQAAGKTQAQLRPDNVDDTLSRLIDVEHPDAGGRSFDPERGQQLLPDLAGASSAACRGDGVVGRRECQFRIVNLEATTFDVEEPTGPAKIVQQVTINVQKIGIFADASNDMLIPYLGQQRAAKLSQGNAPSGSACGFTRQLPLCTAYD